MKAIKIPNAALLDVFGRPVAINSNDPHRPSLTPCISRAGFTETKSLNDAKKLRWCDRRDAKNRFRRTSLCYW